MATAMDFMERFEAVGIIVGIAPADNDHKEKGGQLPP
ncbi:MAG: hypothetical protein USCAAHI_01810 [Beijerinckiaceae bacterium]|jgi:hypothetical protein|nr:MAG: hypothetical protein USCAAHI_01810 [Beijerinckiaceae bacterium]